jgi:hypothetical protein
VASPLPGSSPNNADAQAAIQAAVSAAAGRLSVAPADVHVDQVEAREWGDTSLGCPRPGQMYAQVVTPGFLVIVSAGNKVLEYHSSTRGETVLCQER